MLSYHLMQGGDRMKHTNSYKTQPATECTTEFINKMTNNRKSVILLKLIIEAFYFELDCKLQAYNLADTVA